LRFGTLGIATVRGRFGTCAGTIDASGDSPVLEGSVEVATVDSGDVNRDGHLKARSAMTPRAHEHDRSP
jgi:polyisoprenoid-binding protein YceI